MHRRIVVTGGASGLGAAVVDALVKRGDHVAVLDRVEVLPTQGSVCPFVVDLGDPHAAGAATREAIEALDGLDAVVTCAGTDACGELADLAWPDWERVIAVNLLGTASVVHAALPTITESRGHVVTVASTLGLRALPDATAYCASKFGVVGFTRALAAELRGRVGVTLLVPAGMRTAFFDGRTDQYKPPEDATLSDPTDVAEAVLFALDRPVDTQVRELVLSSSLEPSWP